MSLNERLIGVGAAACTTDTTDVFGDGSGIALYTMDYDASDASGSYDGVPTNVEFGVEGQINYGARFNGSAYVTYNSFLSTTTDNSSASFSIWVKFNSFSSFQAISSGLSGQQPPFNLYVYHSGGTSTFAIERGFGGTVYYSSTYNTEIQASTSVDTWYHIVYTYTASTKAIEVFLNGSSIGTDTLNTFGSGTVTTTQLLGGISGGGSINADLDQYRIFSKALSSNEVSTLYAETACVYTCTTDTVDYPITNLAYYKLDNSAEDETGIYDGTATNVNYTFGRFGQAAVFNGSSSKIVIPSDFNLRTSNSSFTWSSWIKFSNVYTTGFRALVGSQSTARGAFAINMYGTASGITTSLERYYSGTQNYSSTYATTAGLFNYTANVWYHLVVVYDGSTSNTSVFVNGTQAGSTYNLNLQFSQASQNETTIGLYSSGGTGWQGSIDQVRIFSSALTSTQVTKLYEEYECEDTSTFKPVLYTGNGSTQYISNVGFQPDLVWIKSRGAVGSHILTDSIRGDGKEIYSDLTNAEGTVNRISLTYTGFNVVSAGYPNQTNNTFVAWNWKAGGPAVSNTDGTVTSQVSANVDAGFSIVSTQSDGSGYLNFGHGLSQAPELVITKFTSQIGQWYTYTSTISNGFDVALKLNSADAAITAYGANKWSSTDSVVGVGNPQWYFTANVPFITYCFHSVAGVSKIGSYAGTGLTGNAITGLGFEPSFVMLKSTNFTGSWFIYDNRRGSANYLRPDLANNEGTDGGVVFNSDGFTINVTYNDHNASGGTYIYMAFK